MCFKELGEKIQEVASNLLLEPQTDEKTWQQAMEKSKPEARQETNKDKPQDVRVIDQP